MTVAAPPRLVLEALVRAALAEDLGRAGDITTAAAVPADARGRFAMAARSAGRIAGLDLAELAFTLLDPALEITRVANEGGEVAAGARVLELAGRAHPILGAERVGLNFVAHLSGVATLTSRMVAAVGAHKARIAATRKTTPGLRVVEKYAVQIGGGVPHRYGLDDAVLIKDNHIALAGGLGAAVRRVKAAVGHTVKIEVELDALRQLDDALREGVDIVLLDNMSLDDMAAAVRTVNGRALVEASGGVTLERVPAIAATGVDLISVGALTHSAPHLDVGLDFLGSR